MRKIIKVNDSSQGVSVNSRAHKYWAKKGYQNMFVMLRPGVKIPNSLKFNNIDSMVKLFNLKGIAFGNWVTTEDRLNYLHALFLSFYDLNKLFQFNYNIGVNKNLTVTFGDRGIPGSLAHYSPASMLININRYRRGSSPKIQRFLDSGGIHSFAHEYGHFLDFFCGSVIERNKNVFSCSGGNSISKSRLGINTPIRSKFDDILELIIHDKGILSSYYRTLLKNIDEDKDSGKYWIQRDEMFARAFEAYIKYALEEKGIKNQFLTKQQYENWYYIKKNHVVKLAPHFKELLSLIRKAILIKKD